MKKELVLLIFWLVMVKWAGGQELRHSLVPVYALANMGSPLEAGPFGQSANAASLAGVAYRSAGFYGERRFLLSELASYYGALALPVSSGSFGLTAAHFGFRDYGESELGIAYAQRLGKIDVGARFVFNDKRVPGYGRWQTLYFEWSSLLHVTEQLHAGVSLSNPVAGRRAMNWGIAPAYTAGLTYDVSPQFVTSIACVHEADELTDLRVALLYHPAQELTIRSGICTATASLWLGVELQWREFRLAFTMSSEPRLGITPGLFIIAQPGPDAKAQTIDDRNTINKTR